MDDAEIATFVSAWLRENAGVIDEIVAWVGDSPSTRYGAALEALMRKMSE